MNLDEVIRRMRLDQAAIDASHILQSRGIDHLLIKGPTTADWLYDPPRPFADVDLLIEPGRGPAAVASLLNAHSGSISTGAVGETASHSSVIRTASGIEIDVHASLPLLAPSNAQNVWDALQSQRTETVLNNHSVPALEAPARCLVLALHFLGSLSGNAVPREDLSRARERCTETEWRAASELASLTGLSAYWSAANQLLDAHSDESASTAMRLLPKDAQLLAVGASGIAVQVARLKGQPRQVQAGTLMREAFPSRAFMQNMYGRQGRLGLCVAYLKRLRMLLTHLPAAVREIRALRRK